ncbi:MAG: hypothetical protein IH600_01540 [Bacteroidetes bacterium]|nr:hypothetical protein [Bacteroidota bacterium]
MKRRIMRIALGLLTITLFSLSASAQEQETLFASPIEHGGFGAAVAKMTPIRGEMALMVGGYGGWLINHQFMLGGGGYGLVTNVRASSEAEAAYSPYDEPLYLEFGYGGVMLEYIIAPSKLVHINVNALIGGGGITYRDDWLNNWYDDMRGSDTDPHHYGRTEALFVVEPTVNVELNVTEWFRISAGASYRVVTGIDELRGIENKDLSGPSGQLALKFGAF